MDNGWFEALKSPNVELVTDAIAEVTEASIVTAAGDENSADVIVSATDFKASDYLWPMRITGRDGAPLADIWSADGARACWGVVMLKMPNLF